MFENSCPICRSKKVENNHCIRCNSDLTELRQIEGSIAAFYCSIFSAIRKQQYGIAINLLLAVKKLKNDSFAKSLERFLMVCQGDGTTGE